MRKRTLRIRMKRSFKGFDDSVRAQFLDDLSTISGCPVEEIESIRFTSGCVIFDGELDKEAVRKLIEYFDKRDMENAPSDIAEFKKFLEKWTVSNVHSYMRVRVEEEKPDEEPNDKTNIVFVHGWRGDEDSFGRMPEYLETHVECKGLVYEYPTGIWEKSPSLEFIARNLDNWIRNHVTTDNIAIISHSMGGLIVRRLVALQFERKDRIDSALRQLTFIASPHNGAALANLGKHVPILQKTQLRELDTGSPFLFSLNSDWLTWTQGNNSKNCSMRCIVGTGDKVVSPNSAMGLDPNPVPILNKGHIDIVKPENSDDEVILTTARFLTEAGFTKKVN
tara:strand:+ start:127 stop:1134 length:1008 start_codon:yes stop_codon:yes gene_type:complete